MNNKQIRQFEEEIGKLYEQGKIKAPVHLAKGNERQLKRVFKDYRQGEWVCSTHRSHLHWLFSGRDPIELKRQILEGFSMHIFGKNFFSSAIVAGSPSVALGLALGLKLSPNRGNDRVWCFVGDAAYECGITQECIKYAKRQDLPIVFVIENNNKCVRANTQEVWGTKKGENKVKKYTYKNFYPHDGTGKYIMF